MKDLKDDYLKQLAYDKFCDLVRNKHGFTYFKLMHILNYFIPMGSFDKKEIRDYYIDGYFDTNLKFDNKNLNIKLEYFYGFDGVDTGYLKMLCLILNGKKLYYKNRNDLYNFDIRLVDIMKF